MSAGGERTVVREARAMLTGMRSLQLASVGSDGLPLASYAPFVHRDAALYVCLSRLAQHTGNLRRRPGVSALLIRDEADCEEIFARPRLVLDCEAREHARSSSRFEAVMAQFETRFGATAGMLRELPDFSVFALRPRAGRLISGFARAVALDAAALASLFGDPPDASSACGTQ